MKIDFKKQMKQFYRPSAKQPAVVDIPEMRFVMIDGRGDPNTSQEYQDALQALYGISYTVKFMLKKADILDYVVMPLEGLWWTEGSEELDMEKKDAWSWTSLMMQPDQVTEEHFKQAVESVSKKKNPPALSKVRFEPFHEGLAVQIMHIGPYAAEAPTIERLHKFLEEKSFSFRGKHHEIYLSDPRRTAPEKLKTVIRQPVTE